MKKKFFTLMTTVMMTAMMSVSALAASFNLTASDSYKFDNPLKDTNPTEVTIEYTILAADNAAVNGWDGVMSFYNSSTLGRVSIQTHPYVCWNSFNAGAGWIDHKANTLSIKKGEEQSYKIIINKDNIQMYLNGELLESANTGTSASDTTPIEVTYQNILDEINGCDYFVVGVGQSQYAYWNTEICTLSDVKINGREFTPDGIKQEETTTYSTPQRNTMDYGVVVDEETTNANVSLVVLIPIIIISVIAVVIVVAVVIILVAKSKKKVPENK